MDFAKLIERVKNICLSPQTEWQKIADEPATTGSLFLGYAMILAAIPAIASVVSVGPIWAVVTYTFTLALIFIVGFIVNALANTFNGTQNLVNALKVVIYSSTPAWLLGIFQVIPYVGSLITMLGGLYGIYLMYLGMSPCMKNPQDKSVGYTALVVVIYITLFVLVFFVLFAALASMIGLAALAATR